MIFPVGIEDARVRRVPFVSVLVVLLCVLGFLAQVMTSPTSEVSVDEVYDTWLNGMASGFTDLELPAACPVDEFTRMELEGIRGEMLSLQEKGIELGDPASLGGFDTGGGWDPQGTIDGLCADLSSTSAVDPTWRYGLVPARGVGQAGWITYMFLHGGPLHLLGNLLFFVLLCGPFIEDVWGSVSFGLFFLAGGVLAGVAQVALDPGSGIPIIGASGAISACMGAFSVRFAKRKIGFFYFYMLMLRPRWGTFALPAWLVGGFWLLQDVFYQVFLGDFGGVAYMAHIGGMVFGAGVAAIFELTRFEEHFGHPLDDVYRIGAESAEERQRVARRLGVPGSAMSPPALDSLHPTTRDLYTRARAAFEKGNTHMGTRRLRWMVERGESPRDDGALRYLLARHSQDLDPVHLSEAVLVDLIDVAEDHQLRGPSDRLRAILLELGHADLESSAPALSATPSPAPPLAASPSSAPPLGTTDEPPSQSAEQAMPPPPPGPPDDRPETPRDGPPATPATEEATSGPLVEVGEEDSETFEAAAGVDFDSEVATSFTDGPFEVFDRALPTDTTSWAEAPFGPFETELPGPSALLDIDVEDYLTGSRGARRPEASQRASSSASSPLLGRPPAHEDPPARETRPAHEGPSQLDGPLDLDDPVASEGPPVLEGPPAHLLPPAYERTPAFESAPVRTPPSAALPPLPLVGSSQVDAVEAARAVAAHDPEVRAAYLGETARNAPSLHHGSPDEPPSIHEASLPETPRLPPISDHEAVTGEESERELDALDAALASLKATVASSNPAIANPTAPYKAPEPTSEGPAWHFESTPRPASRQFQVPQGWLPNPQEKSLIDIEPDALLLGDSYGVATLIIDQIVAVAAARVRRSRDGTPDVVITDLIHTTTLGGQRLQLFRVPFQLIDPEALAELHPRPDFAHMELIRALIEAGVAGLPDPASLQAGLFKEYADEAELDLMLYTSRFGGRR